MQGCKYECCVTWKVTVSQNYFVYPQIDGGFVLLKVGMAEAESLNHSQQNMKNTALKFIYNSLSFLVASIKMGIPDLLIMKHYHSNKHTVSFRMSVEHSLKL